MKRRGIVVALLGFVAMLLGTTLIARSVDSTRSLSGAQGLLEQSYELSDQMSSAHRTYYLVNLIRWGPGIVSNERIEDWSLEMFRSAFKIPDGWDRVAQEKNALVFLSRVNPVRAMQLFDKVEDPQPDTDGTFPEDVRADSALPIFKNYWISAKSTSEKLLRLPEIEAQAKRLGETGEYPYRAMAFIIGELAAVGTNESTKESNTIFADLLGFYAQGSAKFLNRNRQFVECLEDLRKAKAIPNAGLFRQALHVFSIKLMQSPKDMDFDGEFKNSKGVTIAVTDDRESLLVEAIPMIREFSPELAAQLTREHPELAKAEENMQFFSAGYISPEIQKNQTALLHSRILQRSLVKEIARMPQSELQNARSLAAKLTDDGIHIEGYTALLSSLVKVNPTEAQQIYIGERTRLQEVKDRVGHLRASVALAKASYDVQDTNGFSGLTLAALDEGVALFDEDSRQRPQLPPYLRKGHAQLTELAEFGAEHGSNALLNRIQQMQNIDLKVDLLVYSAKGIKKALPDK